MARQMGIPPGTRAWGPGHFHCIPPRSLVDAEFAKQQLVLLTARNGTCTPNGQFARVRVGRFGDVKPAPCTLGRAWAACTRSIASKTGKGDVKFLERIFHQADAETSLGGVNRKGR